jgi:predicted esterase
VLDVPAHHAAVVWVPPISAGDVVPRPLLVATHGAGGTPEAHCAYWRALVGERAFVLCPRGVTMDVFAPPEERGYFYPAHPALGREVRAALAALVARYRAHVDPDRAVYAGFSQGATMGALFFAREPAPFAGAVLIEGGAEEWSEYSARTFQQGGGRRVIFACGRRSCAGAARRSAGYLERAGVESRVIDASGSGHTLEGKVREGVAEAFPWLVADDARWASR